MRLNVANNKKPDFLFAILAFLLIFFGIVMISSSSIVVSFENFGSNYHYVSKQVGSFFIGLILMIATYTIDYRFWKRNAFLIFLITIILLILIFVPGVGFEAGGARRWIGIGRPFFQPSEFIKFAFIIYLAAWLDKKSEKIKDFASGFVPFVVLVGIIGFLIMKQPDLGTMSIITLTAALMFFVSGADLKHILVGAGGLLVIVGILIKTAAYRLQRFLVFLNPSDSQGAAYHINQALLAIGSGGLWGLGFGQSRQKYLYLPMAHTDSVFAIIAEELGFVRSSLVLVVLFLLVYRGYKISKKAPDNFARLLVIGIISWILMQAFVNIASMLSLLPMTGVPLPFISYGGSSLIVLMAAVGLVLNISKHARQE